MMTHSNQMRQLFSQQAINNSEARKLQMLQKQQQQQQKMPPQKQRKKKIASNSTQTQQLNSSQSVDVYLTNSQVLNPSENIEPILIDPTTKIIDLTSPPSSPVPSTVQNASIQTDYGLEFTKIPDREQADRNETEYKASNI